MLGDILGSLISGGVSLWNNSQNQANQKEFNQMQMAIAQQNMALQKEFAQQGISWKVADAKNAGLHPLAALGASTTSFSPVSVGGEAVKSDLGNMGQDIGRALKAVLSQEDRQEKEARDLQLENQRLQNDVLRQSIASRAARESRRAGQVGPGMPTGPSAFSAGAIPVAHLSRAPDRTYGGVALEDKKMETQQEAVHPFKKAYIAGVPIWPSPSSTLVGQNAEDLVGDSGPINAVLNTVGALDHAKHSAMVGWGPYLDRTLLTGGSGYRAKRFRKGRYTAPSYRPWAE